MMAAGEVLYLSLTQDFGFKNILWVFSGRRGIHLWVCDQKARKMSNEVRSAVIDNLNIISVKKK
jgi:DNA primase small subunit